MANDCLVREITKRMAAQDRPMHADISPAALVDTPSINNNRNDIPTALTIYFG
jgi:hypothetical protein